MDFYIVTMYRHGNKEAHSYVLGVYDCPKIADSEADKEEIDRGGNYKAEILICPINTSYVDVEFDAIRKLEQLTILKDIELYRFYSVDYAKEIEGLKIADPEFSREFDKAQKEYEARKTI